MADPAPTAATEKPKPRARVFLGHKDGRIILVDEINTHPDDLAKFQADGFGEIKDQAAALAEFRKRAAKVAADRDAAAVADAAAAVPSVTSPLSVV